MNRENITQLIGQKKFPVETNKVDLIETHISWVIVCDQFVYKIKKPKKYSFLDYSTLTKRKYFCEKEVELNKRLTTGIYLRVTPVRKALFKYFIDGSVGEIIDYAVTMRKLPEERRMDKLLLQNNVSTTDIKNLAAKISAFHKTAHVIREESHSFLKELFNDLLTQKNYLQQYDDCALLINDALKASNNFFEVNVGLLKDRVSNNFIRDCHGDLHSRNIFLLPEPVPFDCLEFNDKLRHIDVLNEIAFLCMDLDAFERYDLSALFFDEYNRLFPIVNTEEDRNLFVFYKAYRANIRAKVNSFRAQDASKENERRQALENVHKYLLLMNSYLKSIVGLAA